MWARLCLFFSRRRRCPRCALVTEVQTCALLIYVGARRFDRGDTALRLTKAGRRYLNRLEPGYAAIRAATDWMAPAPGRRPLRVGVSQSFAIGWQIGRASRRERECQYV